MTLELLKTFCGTDDSRPGLMEPWNAGGKTFAFDGFILIEVGLLEFTRETKSTYPEAAGKMALCFPGWPVDWVPLEIGGLRLNVHYLNLLKALPGIEIAPTASQPVEAGAMPREMPFRFTGGRGLLMPMRKYSNEK